MLKSAPPILNGRAKLKPTRTVSSSAGAPPGCDAFAAVDERHHVEVRERKAIEAERQADASRILPHIGVRGPVAAADEADVRNRAEGYGAAADLSETQVRIRLAVGI